MKYHHKLTPKDEVLTWYNKASENIRQATFIEKELGSDYSSCVHLCVNTDKGVRTIFRIGKRGLDYFDMEPLKSDFMNIRYYRILKLKSK